MTLDQFNKFNHLRSTNLLLEKDKSEVFISYRRADKHYADQLYNLLTKQDVEAWYDPLIPLGMNWRDAIVKHLKNAKVMVILLSIEALKSEELKKELAVAVQAKVQLLAVRLEDVKPSGAFAYELASIQWFDIFVDPDSRLPQLADVLRVLVNEPQENPRTLKNLLQILGKEGYNITLSAKSIIYNNNVILSSFFAISILLLLLYQHLVSPIDELINNGVNSLKAYGYTMFAVTLGSPLLFLSVLQGEITTRELPLLVVALLNSVLLVLLLRNFCFTIYRKWILKKLQK
ncbi:toll/interleukin-1 receptor domain-containing protein [Fibrella aquatilis]|uniref:Toll/interleukin-1 receptor domain-containing protein n=1 Tax=Fibrella aquatilis TaxID=2817059 RepID=A0A939G9E4_9BACT|nr:toll/interleukin-1 receptor domain-containing protein [Fibrella aquatilis]MBO0932537.1 toll/interleukin-1 receptor domain-containing protein [Fibrella aquatilis]